MAGRADIASLPYWVAGLAAGTVGAALFVSAALGSPVLGVLLYFAPLPVFLAGLGWGAVAAGIAALTGMVLLSFLNSFTAGLVFFVLNGAVPFWLIRQALLYRQVGPRRASEPQSDAPEDALAQIEWYPVGDLVLWITGIAVAFFIFATVGVTLAGYTGGVEEALRRLLVEALVNTGLLEDALNANGLETSPDTILSLITAVLPAAAAGLWISLTLGNLLLAQKLLKRWGLTLRPTINLEGMTLPRAYLWGFLAAVALSMVPGEMAYFGGTIAVILAMPYFLLGLAVIHAISRPWVARTAFLGLFYVLLLVYGWPAIPVWLLGMFESWVGLRARITDVMNQTGQQPGPGRHQGD